MAAVPLTPAAFPYAKRTASVGTTCQLYTLPASHPPYLLSIIGDAALKVAWSATATDGAAVPADYEDVPANTPMEWTIPASAQSGALQFQVAAATGTATVTVELTRPVVGP